MKRSPWAYAVLAALVLTLPGGAIPAQVRPTEVLAGPPDTNWGSQPAGSGVSGQPEAPLGG
jgi:hypothetical protein